MLFRNGIRRAHRTERTALALRAAGGAVLAAEQHQSVAEIGRLRRVEQLSQGVLHLDRVLLVLDEAQPIGQTDAVRIAHNGRFAENIPEDEVGGLAADARELEQLLHGIRHPAAVIGDQHHGARLEVARFGAEQAAGLDGLGNLLLGRIREALQGRKLLE